MIRLLLHFLFGWVLSYGFSWTRRLSGLTWVFIFIFVITTAFTGKFYYLKYYGVTVEGVIVGAEVSAGANLDQPAGPKWVKFTAADGKEYYSEITIPVFYTIGKPLKAFHERGNPLTNYADTFWNGFGVFLFGLFILIIGTKVTLRAESRPDEQPVHVNANSPDVIYTPPNGCLTIFIKIIAVIMLLNGISHSLQYQSLYWSGEQAVARVIPKQRPNLSPVRANNEKLLYIENKDITFSSDDLKDHELYEEVNILYDPSDSKKFALDNSLNAYGYLLIGLFLMLYAWGPSLIFKFYNHIRKRYR